MDANEYRAGCMNIINHYGPAAQWGMLQEESAEVIQAVSKLFRSEYDSEAYKHCAEEIADVLVLIDQLIFDGELSAEEIRRIKEQKVQRTLARIREEE